MRFFITLSICLMASVSMMMLAMQGADPGHQCQADYAIPGDHGQHLSAKERAILAPVWQYANKYAIRKHQYKVDARAFAIIVGSVSSLGSFCVGLMVTNSFFGEYLNGWEQFGASCVLGYAAYKIASKAIYHLMYPPAPNGRGGQLCHECDTIVKEAQEAASSSTGSVLGRLWTSPSQTASIVAQTSNKYFWPLAALIKDSQFPADQIFTQSTQQTVAPSSRLGRISDNSDSLCLNVHVTADFLNPNSKGSRISPTITDEFMDMLCDIEGKRQQQPTRWQRIKASCARFFSRSAYFKR